MLSTASPCMRTGRWSTSFVLLMSTICFVLEVLRTTLLSLHHSARCSISNFQALSSLSEIRPTVVVSSANLIMELDVWKGVQLWVQSVRTFGLSTQLCGVLVSRMHTHTLYKRFVCQRPTHSVFIKGRLKMHFPTLHQFTNKLSFKVLYAKKCMHLHFNVHMENNVI